MNKNNKLNSGYKIINELKSGSFGRILLAINKQNNQQVIMKMTNSNNDMLSKEAKYYVFLQKFNITPKYYGYKVSNKHDLLITEYYGHDLNYWISQQKLLNEYMNNYFTHFNINMVLLILYGIIKIIQVLHKYNIIYHDIKPENFLIDNLDNLTFDNINEHLKIIDFGLSEQLTKEQLLQEDYIVNNGKGNISGTLRYCSKKAYNGYEQTYKDDIESIIYLIVYLYQGYLPWQSTLKENKKDKEYLQPEEFIPKELSFLIEIYNKNSKLKFNKKLNYDILLKIIQKYYNKINKN